MGETPYGYLNIFTCLRNGEEAKELALCEHTARINLSDKLGGIRVHRRSCYLGRKRVAEVG